MNLEVHLKMWVVSDIFKSVKFKKLLICIKKNKKQNKTKNQQQKQETVTLFLDILLINGEKKKMGLI